MNGKCSSSKSIVVLLLCFAYTLNAAPECASLKGIASNNFFYLAGEHDTIWAITHEGNGRYAVNTLSGSGNLSDRVIDEKNWNARYLCGNSNIRDMAYSSGALVICIDSVDRKPNDVYVFYKGSAITSKQLDFPWNDSVKSNSDAYVMAFDVTESNGIFFFACLDGGMVRWDSRTNRMSVLVPGMVPQTFSDFNISSPVRKGARVESVNASGDTVVVTTPEKIWIFNDSDSSWDSSTITNRCSDTLLTITSFEYALFNRGTAGVPLYGCIRVSGQTDSLVLCKYNRRTAMWQIYMDEAPTSIAFGKNGIIYTVSFSKHISVFLDTLADEVIKKNPDPLINHSAIQDSMTDAYEIEYPSFVNDILLTPSSDSTANLWIASSEGLFLSEDVSTSNMIRKCVLIKRAPTVSSGLKKTYARPGIISTRYYDEQPQRAVFVYNLSKDAKVTIRIYDFNMDHVKTIISGKFRKAGSNGGPLGRSTVESEDFWNGYSELGKLVAPGVYYYKITADSGERALGKMVVAK